jgi:hypothetical protein
MLRQIKNKSGINASGQKGHVMILALILLVLVSLMVAPLLSFAGSALKQGQALEDRTIRVYAADAGIESAWHNIRSGAANLPSSAGASWGSYSVNKLASGLTVSVTITLTSQTENAKFYAVHSTSITGSGKSTSIDANMTAQAGKFRYFEYNIMTAGGTLGLKNNVVVGGFVQCAGEDFAGNGPTWGDNPDSPPARYCDRLITPAVWPSAAELSSYYINRAHNTHTGGWTVSSDLTLTTTEYVAGNCNLISNTINLNGQTIFVDGNLSVSSVITGTGCLVATGDISFTPNSQSGDPAHGILLVSLGNINFWPGGTFYGWVAAAGNLDAKSGSAPAYSWLPVNDGLNFPLLKDAGGPGSEAGVVIISNWQES